MSNTLEKLIDLRNFICNNPGYSSTKWHKKTSCDYPAILVLKKHGIVVNKGTRRAPLWEWTGAIPNYKTAQRVDELKKVSYQRNKLTKKEVKETKEITYKKMEFADILYGLKIDLNDNISFKVQRDSGRIYRRDNGVFIDFDNINVFNKVLSLLK
jgi:hypothetical protein